MVSFSSQTVSKDKIAKGMPPASSFNILTCIQVNGSEAASNLSPCLKTIYQNKSTLRNTCDSLIDGCAINYHQLHDGKILYVLCQHSFFNRRHHQFLLCKCKRSAGGDANHECELVPHDQQISYWERSQTRWNRKQLNLKNGEIYTRKNHMD